MKRILLLTTTLILLVCCGIYTKSAAQKHTSRTKKRSHSGAPVVGGDRDAHGCIGSAGYVWSEMRQTCIRTFETADARLNSVEGAPAGNFTVPVLFSADKSRAEVYLPGTNGSIVLSGGGNSWKNDSLELTSGTGYSLKLRGKAIYAGE